MAGELEGKAIILTGAATGIGQASARVFAQAGARLLLADINEDGGRELAQELVSSGADAHFVRTNVAVESDVEAMAAAAILHFGRIDGAFNNAGVEYANKPIHELTLADWHRVVDVNLTGMFLCLKYEIAAMLESGGGSIVNTGSVTSVASLPNSAEYMAAKHGVLGLTRSASCDYSGRGFRVNTLIVGATHTPLFDRVLPGQADNQELIDQLCPVRRLGQPQDIAKAALWLLSDASCFVTGSGLTIDGGYLAT